MELARACSPLAANLVGPLMDVQALMQINSHQSAFPHAMRRVVSKSDRAIGHIIVDWTGTGTSHGVDIAVMPDARGTLAGMHMLRAWLDAADQLGYACTLRVLANNPARQIYTRLGFSPASHAGVDCPTDAAIICMQRPAKPNES